MDDQSSIPQDVSAQKVHTPVVLAQPTPRRYRPDDFDFSRLAPQNPRLDQDLRIDGQPKRPANCKSMLVLLSQNHSCRDLF